MLYVTDHCLCQYTNDEGWKRFQILEAMRATVKPWEWPRLDVSYAPETAQFSMQFWLEANDMNINPKYDISHGAWRDVKNSVKDLDLYPHMLLMCVADSVHYRPWQASDCLTQVKDHSHQYFSLQSPDSCPLLDAFWLEVIEDKGLVGAEASGDQTRRVE